MNTNTTYRMTVTVPLRLRERIETTPRRGVSRLVATALEEHFLKEDQFHEDPAHALLKLGEKLPHRTAQQMKKAIEKGRA